MPTDFDMSMMDRQAMKQKVTEHQEMSDFRLVKYFDSLPSAAESDSPAYRSQESDKISASETSTNVKQSETSVKNKRDQKHLTDKSGRRASSGKIASGKIVDSGKENTSIRFNTKGVSKRKSEFSSDELHSKKRKGSSSVIRHKDDEKLKKVEKSNISEISNISERRINRKKSKVDDIEIEVWAKPYECVVQNAIDEISSPLLFRGELKRRFEDKIMKDNVELENLLPKPEIKKILLKCNKRDQKTKAKLPWDKDVRHVIYTEIKNFINSSIASVEFWKNCEKSLYFSPPSECPVVLGANQLQYSNYNTLVNQIAEKKVKINQLLECMDKMARLNKALKDATRAQGKVDTSQLSTYERKKLEINIVKLIKNAKELMEKLTGK